jgi:competence protein CoiA
MPGLASPMLVAELHGSRIEADHTLERGEAYQCPECKSQMILKAGVIKIAHFAHKVDLGCDYMRGEGPAHMAAKRVFCDAMRARGLRVEPEYKLGDQRADLAAWSPKGRLFVLEMQNSPISSVAIEDRITKYKNKGVPQIWFPFINNIQQTGEKIDADYGTFRLRYGPRDFERALIGHFSGRLWYYDPESELVHLSCWPPNKAVGAIFSMGFRVSALRFRLADELLGVVPHFGDDS